MIASNRPEKGTLREPFSGFEPLTANFIYCPNQFFDVCLSHSSRGVVRLVAYLLRRTLGWLDKNGEPIEQEISVSYAELVEHAGISRGAIRPAIDEAIQAGFLACVRSGRKGVSGCVALMAQYQLCWDASNVYVKDPAQFSGFYAKEGNRTPIPNAFFDQIVGRESLAVVKVVGTVLRHTVGYQNQFGMRRSQAPLSYSFIQDFANMKHRPTLAEAIRVAIANGYIVRVEEGRFDPSGRANRPAAYAVRWLGEAASCDRGSKTEPVNRLQFKNRTGSGSESEPAEQFKYRTDRKTDPKDTYKQQDETPVVVDLSESFRFLRDAGFDDAAAHKLARHHPVDEIKRQIDWLEERNPSENRLGMLHRAIEGKWSEPPALARKQKKQATRQQQQEQAIQQATEDAAAAERKRQRRQRRVALLQHWQCLSTAEQKRHHQTAIDEATSEFLRRKLRESSDLDQPPIETLEVMARVAVVR